MLASLNRFKNLLSSNLSIMFIGTFSSNVLNIILLKFLTNKFPPNDFGTYSLVMALSAFPQVILFTPLSAAILPFFKKLVSSNQRDLLHQIFELFIFINIIFLLLIPIPIGLSHFTELLSMKQIHYLIIALIFSSTVTALTILDSFSLANNKINEFIWFPVGNIVIKIVFLIILIHIPFNPIQIILIFSLGQILLFLIQFYWFKKKKIIKTPLQIKFTNLIEFNSYKKEILLYSSNLTLWGIFAWLQTFCDKWILNTYSSPKEVGIYAIYFQYGVVPFTILSSIFSQYITPKYFSYLGNHSQTLIFMKKLFKLILITFLPMIIIAPLMAHYLGPYFIELLTSSLYLESIELFIYPVIAGVFFFYGQILAVPLMNEKLIKKVRVPKILSSILSVLLFLIFIPRLGILGVFISLISTNIFYFMLIALSNITYFRELTKQACLTDPM